jgi:hypothetical protein
VPGNEAITLIELHVRDPAISRAAFPQWRLRDRNCATFAVSWLLLKSLLRLHG